MGHERVARRVLALVVEDEPIVAKTFARALRAAGADVRIAGSADEILRDVTEDEWARVDIALLDVGLPGKMHGDELAAVVRARSPRAEIALVSGNATADRIRSTVVDHNVAFMTKPVSMSELSRWAAATCARAPARLLDTELLQLAEAHGLSNAELAVLRHAASTSAEHKDIAAALGIEVETVRSHAKAIRRKTDARSLRELAQSIARRSR